MRSMIDLFNVDNWKNLGRLVPKPVVDETAETFVQTLLLCMQAKLVADPRYRKNIDDFSASYMLMSQDECVAVNVCFDDGKMTVREEVDENADLFLKFKNGKALMNFILKGGNILKGLLNNEIVVEGNWNYMYKLAFMVKELELSILQRVHASPHAYYPDGSPWKKQDLAQLGDVWTSTALNTWLLCLRSLSGQDTFSG